MRGRTVLGVAAAVFVSSWICAAVLLPDRIEMYYTPTDRPDFVYARGQYLIVTLGAAVVLTVAAGSIARAIMALINAFIAGETANNAGRVGYRVAAWTLLWAAAVVWLTIWLGNAAQKRSWGELLAQIVGLLGGVLIVGLHAWAGVRRNRRASG